MYESPIEMIITEIMNDFKQNQEKQIYEIIQHMNINVSKEELIKALNYDRQQYEKGYNNAIEEFAEDIKKILAPTVSALFLISKTLVEASKQHISPEEALKNIRVQLSEKQPICSKLQLEEVLDKHVKEMEIKGRFYYEFFQK